MRAVSVNAWVVGECRPWHRYARPLPPWATTMRIVLCTDTVADVNGVSRFVADLLLAAGEAGERLAVVASTRKVTHFAAAGQWQNLPPAIAFALPGYRLLDVAVPSPRALARALDAAQPDVVHISTPGPVGVLARQWALRRGVPMVGTYHTNFPQYARAIYGSGVLAGGAAAFTDWFYRPFARLLFRSEASHAQHLGTKLALDARGRSRTAVLPPGTRMCQVGQLLPAGFGSSAVPQWIAARAELAPLACAITSGRAVLLSVGRLSREKNLEFLIDVMQQLVGTAQQASLQQAPLQPAPLQQAPLLVIAGDGPARQALERRATRILGERGARENVCFCGFVGDSALTDLYRLSSALLFASQTDTLGQVVMEAQVMGVTPIISPNGPVQLLHPIQMVDEMWMSGDQTSSDLACGVVVPNLEAAAWAKAVGQVLAARQSCAARGVAGDRLARRWPFSRTFDAFWGEHRKVLDEHRIAASCVKSD